MNQLHKSRPQGEYVSMKEAHQSFSDDNLELYAPCLSYAPPRSLTSTGMSTCDGCGLDALLDQAPLGIPRATSALDALVALPDSVTSSFFVSQANISPRPSPLHSRPAPASSKGPGKSRHGSSSSLFHPIPEPDNLENIFPVSDEELPVDCHWPDLADCSVYCQPQAELTKANLQAIQTGYLFERTDSAYQSSEGAESCSSQSESDQLCDPNPEHWLPCMESLDAAMNGKFGHLPLELMLLALDVNANGGENAGVMFANSPLSMQTGPLHLGHLPKQVLGSRLRRSLSTSALPEC
eukprot:gene18366-24837_t